MRRGNEQSKDKEGGGCWTTVFRLLLLLAIAFGVFQCTRCVFFTTTPEERIQEAIERAAAAETDTELATAEAGLATVRAEATQIVVEATAEAKAKATAEAKRSREATAEAVAESRRRTAEGQEKLDKAIREGDIDEIEDLIDDGVQPAAFRSCLGRYNNPSARSKLVNLFHNDLVTELPVAWRTGVKMNSAVADYIADRHTWTEASHEICKALFVEANVR